MVNERARMLRGDLYDAQDPELVRARRHARGLLERLNRSEPDVAGKRTAIAHELLGSVGEGVWIEPPFFCDYGSNIHLGDRVFINFNCVFLDPAEILIGDSVLLGPSVQIYTATHPLDHVTRSQGLEAARPVCIGSEVWVGGGAILLPGARVGARSVVGAGSVVSGEIPEDVLAVGNPCRVMRKLR